MASYDPQEEFDEDAGDAIDREWLIVRAASGEPETFADPLTTSLAFLNALQHLGEGGETLLERIVTPESRADWGDFQDTAADLERLGQWGVGSQPKRAVSAIDVAYTALLPEVPNTPRSTTDPRAPTVAVITSVWRPERGLWMVHAF